jgi:hypothetical protein
LNEEEEDILYNTSDKEDFYNKMIHNLPRILLKGFIYEDIIANYDGINSKRRKLELMACYKSLIDSGKSKYSQWLSIEEYENNKEII